MLSWIELFQNLRLTASELDLLMADDSGKAEMVFAATTTYQDTTYQGEREQKKCLKYHIWRQLYRVDEWDVIWTE